MSQMGNYLRRPPLVAVVGIIAIVAGAVPFIEVAATLTSSRFASFFLGLVREIVQLNTTATLVVLITVGLVDIALGIGVLMRYRSIDARHGRAVVRRLRVRLLHAVPGTLSP